MMSDNQRVTTMDTLISGAADYLSANCFLNAYVREFDDWRVSTSPSAWQASGFPAQALVIPLGHRTLWIGVQYWSQCGRHRFTMPARCEGECARDGRELGFLALAKTLVENAAIQTNGTIGAMARFLERIMESHRNLEMLLALREAEIPKLMRAPLTFGEAEQALLIGHSVHPAPKVRQPMTLTEAVEYGPEGGSGFALMWMLVRNDRIQYRSADDLSLVQRVRQLIAADESLNNEFASIPDGYTLLPAHPWQVRRLQRLPALQGAFANDEVILLSPLGQRWFATSSMRSIYRQNAPYMLKFSLSVRLTNSVRHLQPAEAERGCLISKVLATQVGQHFQQRFSQFDVMEEPAYLCLLDDAGEPVLESMMVFRDNPINERPGRQYNVLATLTQDHPFAESGRLTSLVDTVAQTRQVDREQAAGLWFDAYLAVVVKPLLLAQSDYGLLFGAHQQNIVLALQDGMPVHCYFRDCQGTGFSALGARLFQLDHNALGEAADNQIGDEMAIKLFAYYLIINSTFGVISAMGADGVIDESELIDRLRAFFVSMLTPQRQDNRFISAMLASEELWQKGNFICSLADLNENTLADPVSIYRAVNNPVCSSFTQPQRRATTLC